MNEGKRLMEEQAVTLGRRDDCVFIRCDSAEDAEEVLQFLLSCCKPGGFGQKVKRYVREVPELDGE